MDAWTRCFLEAQGHVVNGCDIYQDNQSVMLIEKNGRVSSGMRTRHINIQYFFVTDRVASGEAEIKCCPTDDVVGDCFTKRLKGASSGSSEQSYSTYNPWKKMICQRHPRTAHRGALGIQSVLIWWG